MTETPMTDNNTMTETPMPDVLYTKHPRGRPSLYSEELAEEICDRIAGGQSLRKICEEPGMPGKATVMRWLQKHEKFRDRYRKARELLVDRLADEMVEIADEAGRLAKDPFELAKAKLRIDARKWLITHLAAKKYGKGDEPGEQPYKFVMTPEDYALCYGWPGAPKDGTEIETEEFATEASSAALGASEDRSEDASLLR